MFEDLDTRKSMAKQDMSDAQAAIRSLQKEKRNMIWIAIILGYGAIWFFSDELSTSAMLLTAFGLVAYCQFYQILLENRCEILRAEMRQLHRESLF
tara:strand:- start:1719 stop:2006 length:288 start_codon:yes stop_codon:yes gene_type:complete